MTNKIIAIGGGDFRKNLTLSIDREIVKFASSKKPKLLFIPTASSDHEAYSQGIKRHFSSLGCSVDFLFLIREKPTLDVIENKIMSADIIYVGGGNTLKMMNLWRRLGVDRLLAQACNMGKVMCGLSAGSICWFNYGNSDSRKFKNPNAEYIRVKALGFVPAFNCPHYDTEPERKNSLKKMMKKSTHVAIAIDDCAAIQIYDDKYKVLSTKDSANCYKVFWHKGQFYEKIIPKIDQFILLDNLLQKQID